MVVLRVKSRRALGNRLLSPVMTRPNAAPHHISGKWNCLGISSFGTPPPLHEQTFARVTSGLRSSATSLERNGDAGMAQGPTSRGVQWPVNHQRSAAD